MSEPIDQLLFHEQRDQVTVRVLVTGGLLDDLAETAIIVSNGEREQGYTLSLSIVRDCTEEEVMGMISEDFNG